jgi:hypothetical protein
MDAPEARRGLAVDASANASASMPAAATPVISYDDWRLSFQFRQCYDCQRAWITSNADEVFVCLDCRARVERLGQPAQPTQPAQPAPTGPAAP